MRWRHGRRALGVAVLFLAILGSATFPGAADPARRGACTQTLPATNVGSTGATLNGNVSCGSNFSFAYGTQSGVYTQSVPAPSGPGPVSSSVGGLAPGTTYFFQLRDNGAGFDEQSFTTSAAGAPPPSPPYDPVADVGVSVSVTTDKPVARIGDTLNYSVLVRNWGPRQATGVAVSDVLPAQVSFVSVSTTRGSCSGGSTVTCSIGLLNFGESATVTITGKATAAGDAIDTASVSNPDQPDNNSSNQTSTVTTAIAPPLAPAYGESFNVRLVSGVVLVRLPGTTDFVSLTELTNVPQGAEVDTTNGRVEITSASDPAGDPQTAEFYDGRFILAYAPARIGTAPIPTGTPLTLVTQLELSQPLSCSTKRRTAAPPPGKVRGLWGTGKGNFRTRGRFAAATVRGTDWFVQDACKSTTVKVRQGTVDVYDFVLIKHVFVTAPKSYTAKKK